MAAIHLGYFIHLGWQYIQTCRVNNDYVYNYRYAPYPPYRGAGESIHPNNFARHLRDEGKPT